MMAGIHSENLTVQSTVNNPQEATDYRTIAKWCLRHVRYSSKHRGPPHHMQLKFAPIARREPLTGTRSDAHVGPEPVRHFHRSNQCLIVVNATSNSSKHSNWCEPLG